MSTVAPGDISGSSGGKRGLSRGDKWLIGCGLGCVGLLVVGLLAAMVGGFWFLRPGTQHPTAVAEGPGSIGVIRLHDVGEDPGAKEMMTYLVQTLQDVDRRHKKEQLPESMRWLADLQGQEQGTGGLEMLLPREATLAFEPRGADADPAWVLALNIRAMARPLRLLWKTMARGESGEEQTHLGQQIVALDGETWSAFYDSTLLVSDHLPSLRAALDRIATGSQGGDPGGTRAAGPEGTWDVEGSLSNHDDGVARFLEAMVVRELGDAEIVPPASGDDLELSFGVDIASKDAVQGRLVLRCADVREAVAWLGFLEPRLDYLRDDARRKGLELTVQPKAAGADVEIPFELSGIAARIDEMANDLTEAASGSGRP
ncbi:MAG: hypothetical protein AAGD06_20495 [Acidobacteriota bacterium]